MIKTKDLSFQYSPDADVLSFPDFELKESEDLLIMGKSGIGKTTCLHLLAGLLQPKDGTISIDRTNLASLSSNELDIFRGKNIGLVFQNNYAVSSLTVAENLQARLYFSKNPIDNKRIDDLLTELGLIEFKNRKINKLSVGQLQRLGIALSVVHKPKVILADEPTSSLDDENCAVVIDLLKSQAEKNNANLIVITHDQRIKSSFKNSITL